MNDEFLYRLRAQPPATFAASLKARLEIQAAIAAARRRAAKWYVFFGILFGAVAVAVVTPTVRTAVVSLFGATSGGDTTPSLARTADGAPRHAVDVGGSRAMDTGIAKAGTTDAIRADSSGDFTSGQTPSANAAPSASSVGPVPRQVRRVVAVVGSQAVQGVLDIAIEAFEETYGYSVEEKLVSADAPWCPRFDYPDVIVTLGRMSDAERTSCSQRGTRLVEVPIAYEAYIAVVHRENTWADALTIEELRTIGERFPHDPLTTWNQLRPSWPSLPITLLGVDSTKRSLNERFVPRRTGRGIPLDVRKEDAGIPKAVEATYGGLGFMSYATYQSQSAAANKAFGVVPVKVLGVVNHQGEVVSPTPKTIQDGSYDTLSRPLLLHFNVAQLYREEVLLFGTYVVEGASQRLSEQGFMPIDKQSMDAAARKLRAARVGR